MSEKRSAGQGGKKIKWDKKKLLTVLLIAVVLVMVLSGKLSLSELLGIGGAETEHSAYVEDPTEPQSTKAETKATQAETKVTQAETKATQAETKATQAETKATQAETKATQAETKATQAETKATQAETKAYVTYKFRSKSLLNQHYDKHGKDMGFPSAEAYQKAACDVINNPAALHKTEKEDGDFVYYVEATNEFAVLSKDGYIRTYFLPDAGKKYYDRQ